MNESSFYRDELMQMRENYREKPMKDIRLSRPIWLTSADPMSEIYSKKKVLLQQGDITYANIVQANTLLFHSLPPYDYPAQIVYSTDPYIAENPRKLSDIAWKFYRYKSEAEDKIPPEWRDIARVIKDEYDRSDFSFSIDSVEYHMIPVMIYRKLLPKRKLCGNLLPVLTVPECKQVLILPKKYWTQEFTEAWVQGII